MKSDRTIVLLSGGQDSSTCLAIAATNISSDDILALTFDYGQRHRKEMNCAAYQAYSRDVEQRIVKIPIMFNSPLQDTAQEIPEVWNEENGPAPTIVPGRNSIFLSIAASIAESEGYSTVLTGISSVDYSGYPDCRPEFFRAMQEAINISTQNKVDLVAPLLHQDKAYMVRTGTRLGVEWGRTWTCYRGQVKACGNCPACHIRLEAFAACGMSDPLPYEDEAK